MSIDGVGMLRTAGKRNGVGRGRAPQRSSGAANTMTVAIACLAWVALAAEPAGASGAQFTDTSPDISHWHPLAQKLAPPRQPKPVPPQQPPLPFRDQRVAVNGNLCVAVRVWGDPKAGTADGNRWIALHGLTLTTQPSYPGLPTLQEESVLSFCMYFFSNHVHSACAVV